jgi:ribonuclease VapC
MVLDSSALVAVLMNEPSADRVVDTLSRAVTARMSAATLVETSIVMSRYYGDTGTRRVDDLLSLHAVRIEAVTVEQALIARDAFLRFGKGRHHAGLNFGDCFSYALAKHQDEPLLFVGDDFARTDVRVA